MSHLLNQIESISKFYKTRVEATKTDPNTYSNWNSKLRSRELLANNIHLPISQTFTITENIFFYLIKGEDLTKQEKEILNTMLKIQANLFDMPMFMKTGNFSNKFYGDCYVMHSCQMADKLKNMYYSAMCLDVPLSTELVYVQLIPISSEFYVFDKIPLTHEYRFFINKKTKTIDKMIDYWNKDALKKSAKMIDKNENYIDKILMAKSSQEKEFKKYAAEVYKNLWYALKKGAFDLLQEDEYSVDLLVDYYGKVWLIDMATKNTSWGLDQECLIPTLELEEN